MRELFQLAVLTIFLGWFLKSHFVGFFVAIVVLAAFEASSFAGWFTLLFVIGFLAFMHIADWRDPRHRTDEEWRNMSSEKRQSIKEARRKK
jgi:hypothetical protein